MMPTTSPDPRHTQLRTWYDRLTARIEALDRDIGWALTQHDRTIHKERRDVLVADRELVTAYQVVLERGEPLPDPWPPEFKTTDLLAAPPPRVLYKSGRCDFYRHIPLPPNYIPRPELLAEVRERLLAGTGGLALTSAIQVRQADVLHGMGGIGKSVLARALCDDPEVQAAFPDGILWTTLGQTPDLTARLREWIETLGGIVGQTAPTLDQLRNTLAEALRDKACLLIADDAWRKAHLAPFCAGGPRCRLLITTRDAALAEGLDAEVYPVPVMAPEQAVALLEEWAQGSLAEVEAEVKTKIVKRLGCLPLAVRLAGAQLRAKDPVEWLASFDARKLKNRRVEAVHDSLEATFALSMDALAPGDRRLYTALSIFEKDEPILTVAIAKLWSALDGRDADETSELLDDLAARALLTRSRGDDDAVTVHDLLRDFMSAELGEEGRIAAHRALLDAYRRTRQGDGWHTAPDDGYLYNHLAYHLGTLTGHNAAAEAELHGLFANQDWLHARVPQSGYLYDGYLADLNSVWRRAHAAVDHQIDANEESSNLADYVHYALIRTSVNALAENFVPGLVARAVETGLWSSTRALSILRRVPNLEHKTAIATALLSVAQLAPSDRREVTQTGLAAAQAIADGRSRSFALVELASHLTGELLPSALTIAEGIADEACQVQVLAALAPHLTDTVRGQAVQIGLFTAQTISNESLRVQALAALAPHLTGELLLTELAAAQTITDERLRADALAALAPHLTIELLPAGLAAAQTIIIEPWRAQALMALAPYLTDELLPEGLATAQAIADGRSRVLALAALVPHLTGIAREEAVQAGLAAVQTIIIEPWRAQALMALTPYLTDELLPEGLATAQAIADGRSRVLALAALVPHLTGIAREEAVQAGLAAAQTIRYEPLQADASVTLASHLTGAAREQITQTGLVAVQAITIEPWRADALAALAPYLAGDLLLAGLAAAQAISDERSRADALAALIPYLTGAAREQAVEAALAAAQAITDELLRAQAVAVLAPHLNGDLLRAGLAAAQVITDELLQIKALAALIPHLTGATRELVGQAGLAVARTFASEPRRAQALADLAQHLTLEFQPKSFTRRPSDEQSRAWALATLARLLTGELPPAGLTRDEAIANKRYREEALAALPHLTGTARKQALIAGLAAARAITDEWSCAQALAAFLPVTSDLESLTNAIRRAMADILWNYLQHEKRDAVLRFCAHTELFTPPILSPDTLAAIAGHIIEICTEWEWL